MVNFYRCPMCGGVLYNNSNFSQFQNSIYQQASSPINNYLVQQDRTLIPPPELPQLKGKQIQTTVPILGTITACIGDYDASRNRVELSNITSVQTGVNHGALDYLPEELVGYRVINQTCPAGGGTTGRNGPSDGVFSEDQLSQTSVIRKNITSFGIPAPTLRNPRRTKTYAIYLDVTVPQVIRAQAQDILDRCMKAATDSLINYFAPYVATALATWNPAPVVSAIPGAIGTATQTFTVCVGSNPIIYPYMNRIKLDIGAGYV